MTTHEEVLRELGQVARAREAELLSDTRYEALSRGELSEDEQRALWASAEGSPDIAFANEVFAPLSQEAQERALSRFARANGALRAPTPIRRSKRFAWAGASLSLAVAAAVLLFLSAAEGPSLSPLPTYAVEVSGGSAPKLLGPAPSASAPLELSPDARLSLTLRPKTAVKGALAAAAFLVRASETKLVSLPISLNDKGVVSLAGARTELFPGEAPGAVELVIVVGRPGQVPKDPSGLRALEAEAAEAEQAAFVGRVDLVLVGE